MCVDRPKYRCEKSRCYIGKEGAALNDLYHPRLPVLCKPLPHKSVELLRLVRRHRYNPQDLSRRQRNSPSFLHHTQFPLSVERDRHHSGTQSSFQSTGIQNSGDRGVLEVGECETERRVVHRERHRCPFRRRVLQVGLEVDVHERVKGPNHDDLITNDLHLWSSEMLQCNNRR